MLSVLIDASGSEAVFSYKLRYIVGFRLVEMAISTNQKPTIYRNLDENTGPVLCVDQPAPCGHIKVEHRPGGSKVEVVNYQVAVI